MTGPGDKYFYRKYGERIDAHLDTIRFRKPLIQRIEEHMSKAKEIMSVLTRKERGRIKEYMEYLAVIQDKYVFELNTACHEIKEITSEREIDEKNIKRAARNRGIPISQLLQEFDIVDSEQKNPSPPESLKEDRNFVMDMYKSLKNRGYSMREAYKLAHAPFEEVSMAEIDRVYSLVKRK